MRTNIVIDDNLMKLALKSTGLDFGAVDLRVQGTVDSSGKQRRAPDFIIIEINSAPSFGTVTSQKYVEHLPTLLKKKYENSKLSAFQSVNF